MWFAILATVVIGALLYKLFFSGPSNYWKRHGVREIDSSAAIGNLQILLGRKSMSDGDDYAYKAMGPDKFCGTMEMGGKPVILIKDLELAKRILIKDFDHFVDRRQLFSEHDGSPAKGLVSLEGDEWKRVRASVSPTFTSGKIRRMMEHFNVVGKEWVEVYSKKATSNSTGSSSVVIDVLQAVNQYTVEVISTTVFGMNAGVIKNPERTFMKMANRLSDISCLLIVKFALRLNFPKLSTFLGLKIIEPVSLAFFETILRQGLRSRLSGETKRNDFLQLLVEAKKGELEAKKGELEAAGLDELETFEKDAIITTSDTNKKQYLTEEIMNAQSMSFFFAGFTTTSNFITFVLYALALNPKVQDRLRQEVDGIFKDDGDLDYDDVGRLVYMDMVVCEVMRHFSVVTRLERICVKEYRDPEIGLVIPKGTIVGIPINSIHHDEQYYENPEKFDPEHFSPGKKAARNPYTFMPFGMGPRNCIGMRFAQIEVKSAIAHMVHSFIIEPAPKTPVPMRAAHAGLQMVPPKNLELKLTPITHKR